MGVGCDNIHTYGLHPSYDSPKARASDIRLDTPPHQPSFVFFREVPGSYSTDMFMGVGTGCGDILTIVSFFSDESLLLCMIEKHSAPHDGRSKVLSDMTEIIAGEACISSLESGTFKMNDS